MGICHLVKLKNSSLGRFDRAGEPALSLDSGPRHQKHKGVVPNWDNSFYVVICRIRNPAADPETAGNKSLGL